MADPNAILLATLDTAIVLESQDLDRDGTGWFRAFLKGSQSTVVLAVKGKDPESQRRITGVRSVPTPDFGQGPWTSWVLDPQTGLYVSPVALATGEEIRIEIDDSAGASTVPQGGGHFRVVEEGGGFVLAAEDRAGSDDPGPQVQAS